MKIGIIGAGIMGKLLAYGFASRGHAITVFDAAPKSAKNCSLVASGMLTPFSELEKSPPLICEMGVAALNQYWPAVLQDVGGDIFFRKVGTLLLSHPRDQHELDRFVHFIEKKWPSHPVYQKITQETLQQMEPNLTHFNQGYYVQEEGQIDNQALLYQLEKYLMEKRVHFSYDTYIDEVQPGKIFHQNTSTSFDWVLDCRGLGGKQFFKEVRGLRGELLWLHAPSVNITRPVRFLHPRYSLYVVPRPAQHYLIGASEIESESHNPISVRTTLELLTAAYAVHPGFLEAHILSAEIHCRPTLSHHLPRIKYTEGLMAVNGLYRHGFLIAPTLMQEVQRYIENGIDSVFYPEIWEKIA